MCDCEHCLLIDSPGSHQFASAVWALSLNHKLLAEETPPQALDD